MNIRDQQQIIGKPETVTIVLKNPYQKLRRQIRCMYCGQFLLVSYKQIAMIIEGAPAALEAITAEIKCTRCNVYFEIC